LGPPPVVLSISSAEIIVRWCSAPAQAASSPPPASAAASFRFAFRNTAPPFATPALNAPRPRRQLPQGCPSCRFQKPLSLRMSPAGGSRVISRRFRRTPFPFSPGSFVPAMAQRPQEQQRRRDAQGDQCQLPSRHLSSFRVSPCGQSNAITVRSHPLPRSPT